MSIQNSAWNKIGEMVGKKSGSNTAKLMNTKNIRYNQEKYNDLPSEVQQYLRKQGISSSTVSTLDNRRLYAAKQAGVKVNSIWATQEDLNSIDLVRRFITITGGKIIDIH